MERALDRFTAIQTKDGYQIAFHESAEEINLSIEDLNDFADRYTQEMLDGNSPDLSGTEKIMFSLWEMVLMPDDIKN